MISGILLAAGRASRFGSNKLLYRLTDGTPIAVAAARPLVKALPYSIAVTPPFDQELAQLLAAEGMHIVINEDAQQGMGTSLGRGIAAASHAQGWVIALADMPFIRSGTISGIVHLLENGALLAAPEYHHRRGHPVGFSKSFQYHLEGLKGDSGAQRLLQRYRDRLQRLIVDDPGIVIDIDTLAEAKNHSSLFKE